MRIVSAGSADLHAIPSAMPSALTFMKTGLTFLPSKRCLVINHFIPPLFMYILRTMALTQLSVLLTAEQEVSSMGNYKVQQVFHYSFSDFCTEHPFMSDVQRKAAHAIANCKSGRLGFHVSRCDDCGHIQLHYSSCRNRNCPCCQSVPTEMWVDRRSAEVLMLRIFMQCLLFHMS